MWFDCVTPTWTWRLEAPAPNSFPIMCKHSRRLHILSEHIVEYISSQVSLSRLACSTLHSVEVVRARNSSSKISIRVGFICISESCASNTSEMHSEQQLDIKRCRPWSVEEDAKLWELREQKLPWTEIRDQMPNRSLSACTQRYYIISRDLQTVYTQADGISRRKAARWTPLEDEVVTKLREEGHTWANITEKLGRWSLQACQGRRSYLKAKSQFYYQNNEWTSEEDEIVRKAVRECLKTGKPPSWKSIGRNINRLGTQVRQRWMANLRPSLKTGRFSKTEDEAILQHIAEAKNCNSGPNWVLVAEKLGRSIQSIEARWEMCLRTNLRKGRWTKDDDDALLSYVAEGQRLGEPIDWAEIALRLRRSHNSAWTRWANSTNPGLRKDRWTKDDIETLHREVTSYIAQNRKPKWAAIARILNRSPNRVWHYWQRHLAGKLG